MTDPETQRFDVSSEADGQRLDVFLTDRFPRFSRAIIRRAIQADGVQVDGRRAKASYRLKTGQVVEFVRPEMPAEGPQPEDIPLDILYEDEHLVAINKPPAMVVHPSKGHWSGTLTAALAFHFEQLSQAGGASRPGIVHRLDRDTSGVIVIAKHDEAHIALARQFEDRTTQKTYLAIVTGRPDWDADRADQPIGLHPHQREKMAIRADHSSSREASTMFRVLERYSRYSLMQCQPKTGRTHQIRVHLAHLGHPVLCDRLYGGRARLTIGELRGGTAEGEAILERQALHAWRLSIQHPLTREALQFEAPLAPDLQHVLQLLRDSG